jgi:hypothetical protein
VKGVLAKSDGLINILEIGVVSFLGRSLSLVLKLDFIFVDFSLAFSPWFVDLP